MFFWPILSYRNLYMDLGSSFIITVIVYSTMIFPAMDSGSFMLRYSKKNADLLARRIPNPFGSSHQPETLC